MSDQPDTTPDLDNLDIAYRPDGRLLMTHFEFPDGQTPCGTEPYDGEIPANLPACPVCALDLWERFAHLREAFNALTPPVIVSATQHGQAPTAADLAAVGYDIVTDVEGNVVAVTARDDEAPPRCRNCKHDADTHNRLGYCNGTPEDLQRPCACPKWEPRNA